MTEHPPGLSAPLAEPTGAELDALTARFIEHLEAGTQLDMEGQPFPAHLIRTTLRGKLTHPDTDYLVDIDPYGLHITDANITRHLDLANITATTHLAITHSTIQGISLGGATLPSLDLTRTITTTAIDLTLATVKGRLDLSGSKLGADAELISLYGDSLQVGGGAFFRPEDGHRFTTDGALRLHTATIKGQLNLSGSKLGADAKQISLYGDVLRADDALIGGPEDGHRFTTDGALRLLSATIKGTLDLNGAKLGADAKKISLYGDNLQVTGGAFFRSEDGHRCTIDGALRMVGATITGQLNLGGAKLGASATQISLYGDGLQVGGGAFFLPEDGHRFTTDGALRLHSATVGQLALGGAELNPSTDQISLYGDNLRARGGVVGRPDDGHRFTTTGALRLNGATINGQLDLRDAELGRNLPAGNYNLELVLTVLDSVFFETSQLRVQLDGCTYQHRPNDDTDLDQWIDLLRHPADPDARHNRSLWGDYHPRAYQQLAKANRDSGHDRDATRILMAQQDHRYAVALRPGEGSSLLTRVRLWFVRFGLLITGAATGYGHRPGRAFWALLCLAAIAAGLVICAANTNAPDGHPYARRPPIIAVAPLDTTTGQPLPGTALPPIDPISTGTADLIPGTLVQGRPPTACTTGEHTALVLRVTIPLINNLGQGNCTFNTTQPGSGLYTTVAWFLQAIAWILGLLYAAAATNLIRK